MSESPLRSLPVTRSGIGSAVSASERLFFIYAPFRRFRGTTMSMVGPHSFDWSMTSRKAAKRPVQTPLARLLVVAVGVRLAEYVDHARWPRARATDAGTVPQEDRLEGVADRGLVRVPGRPLLGLGQADGLHLVGCTGRKPAVDHIAAHPHVEGAGVVAGRAAEVAARVVVGALELAPREPARIVA